MLAFGTYRKGLMRNLYIEIFCREIEGSSYSPSPFLFYKNHWGEKLLMEIEEEN